MWKYNTGFCAARLVSFVGLPPNWWSLVSKRNAELRLIREDNSRPLSKCPALLKIQEASPVVRSWHSYFLYSAIGCWLWCRHTISIPLLDNFPAILKSVWAYQFCQLPVIPLGGNMFAATFLASRWLTLQTLAHSRLKTAYFSWNLPLWLSSCREHLDHHLLIRY